MIIDWRCPCCNRPVKGRHTLCSINKLPVRNSPAKCQHCKTKIKLAAEATDLGSRYYEEVTS